MFRMMFKTILFCLCMTACTDNDSEYSVIPPEQESGVPQDYTELMNKTVAVPAEYEQEAEHRGSVVRIDYATRDYAEGTGRRVQTQLISICHTVMMRHPTSSTTCFISCMGTKERLLLSFRMKTSCCANCLTT